MKPLVTAPPRLRRTPAPPHPPRRAAVSRLLAVTAVCGLALALVPPAAADDPVDETPGEHLGGYTAQAAGMAFSFQPIFEALLPTGDAPVETTVSLSNANVKSGGNAFGRGSVLWPGSAAANLRPLLLQVPDAAPFAKLIPDWPAAVESDQTEGEQEKSVPGLVTMRSFGARDRAAGESRFADVEFPGVLRIDSVTSTSSARVTDVEVNAESRAVLKGVDILEGVVTVEEIRSVSRAASVGSSASSEGDVDLVGMKVLGFDVSVTDDGLHVEGAPDDASDIPGFGEAPFPGASPEEQVKAGLEQAGITITLFESTGAASGGSADRIGTGLYVSIDNPAGGQALPLPAPLPGGVPPSRFDFLFASTSVSTVATEPFVFDGPSFSPSSPVNPSTGTSSPSVLGDVATLSPSSTSGSGGGPLATVPGDGGSVSSAPAGEVAGPVAGFAPASNEYEFEGVPMGLVVGLLVIAGVGARYVRNFMNTLMATEE